MGNVGIATGQGSGIIVLDVDPENGGLESLAQLERQHGPLPVSALAETGGKGFHHVYVAPAFPVTNSAGKLGPGLDIRGEGGQIAVSPSVSGRGAYRWVRPVSAAVPAPAWLLDLITGKALPAVQAANDDHDFGPAGPDVLDAAREALRAFGPAVDGDGGGLHTVTAAAILTHDYCLADDEALPLFEEWNQTCVPPWEPDELQERLRRGRKYGKLPYGWRRKPLDAMGQIREVIAAWTASGEESAMPAMIARVQALTHNVGTLANRGIVLQLLKVATRLGSKELDLTKDVDPVARAEREERQRAFSAGDPGLIDPRDPYDTAGRFLATTRDAAGVQGLIRTDDLTWLERRDAENRWAAASDEAIHRSMIAFLSAGKVDRGSGQPLKQDRALVEGSTFMLKGRAHVPNVGELPAWIERQESEPQARNVVAFVNGLLDVETRAFIPPTRRFLSLNSLPYSYDPAAPEPRAWLAFLNELWPDDSETRSTLQEMFGLLLTADTSHQRIFGLIGARRGGKGTIARVLTALVGSENVCSPALGSFGQTFGLQQLIGKTVGIISDARLSPKTDMSALSENLLRVSGEDAVDVNRKYLNALTLRLRTRFVLISNEIPAIADSSGALASRFLIIRFGQSFLGREDPGLTDRLLGELPGVLLWALAGLGRLRARGHFIQPASGREALEDLERLGSPVKHFVEECCEVRPGARVACASLFDAWRIWCSSEGREHPGNAQSFGRHLGAAFPGLTVSRPRIGGAQVRHFEGIGIRSTPPA